MMRVAAPHPREHPLLQRSLMTSWVGRILRCAIMAIGGSTSRRGLESTDMSGIVRALRSIGNVWSTSQGMNWSLYGIGENSLLFYLARVHCMQRYAQPVRACESNLAYRRCRVLAAAEHSCPTLLQPCAIFQYLRCVAR